MPNTLWRDDKFKCKQTSLFYYDPQEIGEVFFFFFLSSLIIEIASGIGPAIAFPLQYCSP